MKHFLLLLFALFSILVANSQTVVLQEDFEGSTYNFTSSSTGSTNWGITDSYSNTGTFSDSATVATNDTIYLTSDAFSTTGNFNIMLEFSHICKVSFSDGGYLEYSTDNGASWTKITSGYLGTGSFTVQSSAFSTTSYSDWLPGNTTTPPSQSWWKTEQFDLSTLIADEANVKIRFALADIFNPGNENYIGWFIDDVKVTAAFGELIPPTITMNYPLVASDTITTANPITISADITDNSGIYEAYVAYYANNQYDTAIMVYNTADSSYQATIPFFGYGRALLYHVVAADSSVNQNIAKMPANGNWQLYSKYVPGIQLVALQEDFESGFPSSWTQLTTDDFDWTHFSGTPTSSNTGPVGAHSGTYYMYTETSPSTTWGGVAILESPAFNIDTLITPVLSFYYHMYGATMGDLFIDVYDGTSWSQAVWSISGEQHTSENDSWTEAVIDLTSYKSAVTKIRFRSIGGSSYTSDMAIDLVTIGDGAINQPDAGVAELIYPTGGVLANSNFDIRVRAKNFSGDTLNNVDIAWEVNGIPQTTYNYATPILPVQLSDTITLGTQNLGVGAHNLKVWTTNPNNTVDFNSANDTLYFDFYGCSNLLSGTYTIGGATADYPNFAAAVLALNQCGISGPVTFNVNPGTYNEQIEINDVSGSSATNTITFQSATGDSSSVMMTYTSINSANNYIVKLNNTSHIRFHQLGFESMDSTYAKVFDLEGSSDVQLTNNYISTDKIANNSTANMALIHGISDIGSDIFIENNNLENGSFAISLEGDSTANNWNINNNIITGHFGAGISIANADDIEIKYNTILADTNSTSDAYNGIAINNGGGLAEISYNTIKTFSTQISYGIVLSGSDFSQANSAMVYNNMIRLFGNSSTSTLSCGILNQETKNVNYYYNNVHFEGSQSNAASMTIFDNSPTTDSINIVNNNFTNNAGGYVYYVTGVDTSKFNNNYNNLFIWNAAGSGSSNFAYLGSVVSDFNSWKNKTAASNSLNYDPYYISQYDLHTINNLLNGTATPITGITDDIDGDLRNISNPDIGADEFDPSPYDITALAILEPSDACGLSAAESIELQIKNIGSATINGGLTASFRIDTLATIVTESISATINPGDTFNYVFTAKVDMDVFNNGADSTFSFTSWVDLTGDPIHNNDTVFKVVKSKYLPPAPIASDTNTLYGTSISLTAQSADSLIWFESDTVINELAKTNNFMTPVLYDTTTYWVAATSSVPGSKTIGNGTNTQNYAPAYGYYDFGWSSIIYEASEIGEDGLIDSISFYVDNSPSSYVLDNQYIYMTHATYSTHPNVNYPSTSGKQLVYQGNITYNGSGWHTLALQTPFYFNGNDNLIIYTENHDGNYSSGYPQWRSTSITGKVIYDYADNNFPTGTGSNLSTRPNIRFAISRASCISNRVPLTVIVDSIPMHDIGLVSLSSPNSGIELTNAEDLTVTIKNFAAAAKDTLPVAYILDSAAIVRDTLFHTLVKGDSIQYTLTPKLDLDSFKTYSLTVFTELSYDENNNNDTIHKQFTNSPLTYCTATATSTGYEDITYVGVSTFGNYSAPIGAMYTDFTSNAPVNLTLGQTYDISVATGFPPGYSSQYSTWINVFIDYNRDGTFDPATENVFAMASQSSDSVYSTFTVPFTNVVTGKPIRMRVAMRESGSQSNTGPCGTFTWGEVEDYTVVFAQPIPFDAGVTELIAADTTYEGYATNMDAVIMNFGTDTLTNFDIEYVINNGTPVATLYTDTLAPMQIDTVALTTFNSPAGASNVCAYTVVTGDVNTFNDQDCKQFFGVPVKDAYLVDFVEIDDGCSLGLDTVRIWITNIGIDTINGGTINPTTLTAYYQKVGGTAVSETVSNTIYPGDTVLYEFTTLIDLSTNNVDDTIYEVNLWIDYNGDNVNYNDSAFFTIESLHTPNTPIVTSPITINYASPAVLTASATDSIYWFNSDTSNSELYIGSPYVTNLIYADSIYWAEAKGGAAGGWNNIGVGTQTQNYSPVYGFYDYGWSSIIYEVTEIPNDGRIDSISFYVDNSPSSYTMTDQRIYMEHVTYSAHTSTSYPGVGSKQLVYQGNLTFDGSGWFTIVFQTPFEYNGTDNLLIYSENHDGSYTSGYPQWRSSSATDKVIYDYADNTFPTTTGSFLTTRPNIKFWANPTGCPSNRDSVHVQVNPQMANDISAFELLTPTTSVYLTSQEDVELRVMNFGTASQSNFDVAYQINGGTPVVETINATINPGDTIDYTFVQKADLSNVGANYSIKLYTGLTTDGNNTNDTIVRSVNNLQPNYCVSTATSIYGNDIARFSLAGINNSSPSPYDKLYTDFSSTVNPGFLSPGGTYPIEVEISPTSGTYYDEGYVEVYIDLNRDGQFTEPDELVFGQAYTHSSQSTPYLITGSVTLPPNTLSGLTKMRVVNENSSSPLSATDVNPCGTYTYGETEDYNMIIAPRIPKDLGVESIMNLPSITDVNSHDVDIRVRNYGTDTINTFDVEYTLNNGAAITQTVNPTLPLLPGDSVDLIAFATINLQQGQNNICFETVLTNDSNLFNNSKCGGIFLEAVLNIPYYDNFDGTTNNWFNDTLQNQWQLGVPTASTLDSAYSAPNVWATWLDTIYTASSSTGDKLYSPKFIVSNYDSVYVKFWHNIDMDATLDGGYLEFNTGGSNWGLVGYLGDLAATNWYNYSNSGNFYWNSTNGWEQAAYNMNLIDANSPFYQADTVQFRFVFQSNGSSSNDGWVIDDFSMEIPKAPIDGAIDSITSPKSSPIGSEVFVTASVRNAGTQALSNFPIKYSVGTSINITDTFTGTLQPGDTSSFTFSTTFTAPTNQYNLCVEVDITGDPYTSNDQKCKAIDVTAALLDAGVSRIYYPGQPGAPGAPDTTSLSYNPDVYVVIVNYGVNTLTNIPVEYYRLSGAPFSGTDTFVGNLVSGDSVVFHFSTQYESPLGNYQICAKTNLPNDANPSNDGTCKPLYGVVAGMDNAINSDFVLHQNEPNPASDNFKINYELPRDGQIRFELRNSLGQLIKVIEGNRSSGNHTIELDAQSMAAGVYYYSLKFGEASKTLKMVVTK